ncbi:hypothetical protein [Actinomadura mexicana]|uniref:Sulfotransferase family protein n=1 Tax=Actinomadura mexicana TaxID=134959 RepID=A0A239CQW0_9ACTN|nr:hypothetical protein [Actinomadura mexicana]SNS22051.1 hypothetical protein SAMN06265355_11343 [Actinomadura mexicana]
MAGRIILHIGVQKSGTTFLQQVLQANADALAAAGVRYPVSPDWARGKRTVANHEWASYGLLGTEFPWVSQDRASEETSSWQTLLDDVQSTPGTVLLSAEALSVIRTPAIHRLLDALGTDDVEVVVTARSLGSALPSLWQQHIRNGRTMSFEGYLSGLAAAREKGRDHIETDASAHLWRAFHLGGLAQRWSDAGATRVSVVTTPGKPPHLLWQRFAEAIGVPALAEPPDMPTDRAHTGLTAPETLVLSSMNAAIREAAWSGQNADWIRQAVTARFQARTERGSKVVTPPNWQTRLAEWSEEDLTALRHTPAQIVGDMEDLRCDPSSETTAPPTHEEIAQAGAEAALALAAVALQETLVQRNIRRLRHRLTT